MRADEKEQTYLLDFTFTNTLVTHTNSHAKQLTTLNINFS